MSDTEEMILAAAVVAFLIWAACHSKPAMAGSAPVASGALGLVGSEAPPQTGNTGDSQIFRGQTTAFFGAFQPSCGAGCNCQ